MSGYIPDIFIPTFPVVSSLKMTKHNSNLLPTLFSIVFTLSVNVDGCEEVNCSNIEGFSLISLILCWEGEFTDFLVRSVTPGCHCCFLGGGNLSVYDINLKKMALNWLPFTCTVLVVLGSVVFNLAKISWSILGGHERGCPASDSLITTW